MAYMNDFSSKNISSKDSRYRPEIDGLRAFAVIAVIINHFNKEILPGGYLGVDIFFVISGFVITSSLYQRPCKNFKDFISGFYERRVKRLVPALSVFVLITSIAICLFNPYPGTSLLTGLTSLFGLSNLYLLNYSTDYFAQSTELNVFTHTWSLGIEEQFYILFPFLIWFSGFGKQTKNGARNLFLAVGAMTIGSLIGFIYLYPTNQPAAYFLMPSRFWEMATGCLIFLGLQKKKYLKQFLEKVPSLLVLTLIVGVMYLPILWASASTIAIVALSSVLIASFKKQTKAFIFFTNPNIVYIGLISYSLYLWHWGIISISRWTIGIHWWSVPFQIALMFGLAIASYRYIETPLRKQIWFERRWKTLVFAVVSLSITALSIVSIPKTSAKQFLESIGKKLYPYAFTGGTGIPHKDFYCHHPSNIETAFKDCLSTHENNDYSRKIFLIGDSHAANHHWSIQSALHQTNSEYNLGTLIEYGFLFYLLGKDSCSSQKICINNAGNAYKDYFRNNLSDKDYVFISISRDRFSVGQYTGVARKQNIQRTNILRKRLLDILQIIEEKGAYLVLIGDIPKVCPDNINYLQNIIRIGRIDLCETKRSISIEDRKEMNNVFLEIAKSSSNTIYVDPHDELCNGAKCRTVDKNGKLLYSDSSPHFTENNKDILREYWKRVLNKIGISDK